MPSGTRPNFENRLSKDDMSLTGQMGMSMGRTKGLHPYRFGVRGGGLPTPEASPVRMPSPSLSSIASRMPTPESLASGEIQIGMAIGSPTTHAPSPLSSWYPPALTPPRDTYSPQLPQRTPDLPIQRQKTQRRKFFASLFGSKRQPEPAKTPEPNDVSSAMSAAVSNSSSAWSGETTPSRSNTVANRKTPKFKPLVVRSRTEPQMEDAIQDASRPPPEIQVTNSGVSHAATATPDVISLGGAGLLDIEIPDVRLERYSIMFSGVLNPQGAASTASSLLARRQATLEKLKTINDKVVSEEMEKERGLVRRATSPQPTKSPGFSLFPSAPGRQQGQPSPRWRSNTSPALLPSPSRTSFEPDYPPPLLPEVQPRKEGKRVTIVSPRTMDERNRVAQVEKLREQQAETQKTQHAQKPQHFFGPEESALCLDSPQSISDVDEIVAPVSAVTLKPRIQEPQWEIITPPPPSASASSEADSTTTKGAASSSPTAPSTASSVQTHITRPSLEVEEDDAALKAAVEISIARQISISRQQRNLLRTTTTMGPASRAAGRTVRSASAGARMGPAGPASQGVIGRVVDTKQSVPTLVDIQLTQQRKSQSVVLEAA